MGQPHRIDALNRIFSHICARKDVWLATGGEITDWFYREYAHLLQTPHPAAASAKEERG
jgi:hypothetical protein